MAETAEGRPCMQGLILLGWGEESQRAGRGLDLQKDGAFALPALGATRQVLSFRRAAFSIENGSQLAIIQVFTHSSSSFFRAQRTIAFLELPFSAQQQRADGAGRQAQGDRDFFVSHT